jgi:hypothetical protein
VSPRLIATAPPEPLTVICATAESAANKTSAPAKTTRDRRVTKVNKGSLSARHGPAKTRRTSLMCEDSIAQRARFAAGGDQQRESIYRTCDRLQQRVRRQVKVSLRFTIVRTGAPSQSAESSIRTPAPGSHQNQNPGPPPLASMLASYGEVRRRGRWPRRGNLQPLNPGTLELWNPGTREPWNPGTLEPWNPSRELE